MIVKRLVLKNYRCFGGYALDFTNGINVIIGRNGTGKTNSLDGVRWALSYLFASSGGAARLPNPLYSNGFSGLLILEQSDFLFDRETRSYSTPLEVNLTVDLWEGDQSAIFLHKERADGNRSPLEGYRVTLEKLAEGLTKSPNAPLLVYFSDSYPHVKSRETSNIMKQVQAGKFLPRFMGYHQWESKGSNSYLWIFRLAQQKLLDGQYNATFNRLQSAMEEIERGKPFGGDEKEYEIRKMDFLNFQNSNRVLNQTLKSETEFVDKKIIAFSKPLRDDFQFINPEFEVKWISGITDWEGKLDLELNFVDGRSMAFSTMPTGYRRLFSIVLDIASRAFCLNGHLEDPEPEGIVMIDEIELHLHPALAQEVLERLHKTFPKLQFIVTTHSPLVISNMKKEDKNGKKNQVIKLTYGEEGFKPEYLPNFYGTSYDLSLNEIMGANFRIPTLNALMDMYITYRRKERQQDADRIWSEIEELLEGNSERVKEELEHRLIA